MPRTDETKGRGVGYTILVAEDSRDTRNAIRLLLESEGYGVIEADNGVKAVENALRVYPDAILMDMSLPIIDGCQATRSIRAEPKLALIPIIAFTAYNRWEWRGKAIVAGCTDFLTKPLKFERVLSMLVRHLPLKRST